MKTQHESLLKKPVFKSFEDSRHLDTNIRKNTESLQYLVSGHRQLFWKMTAHTDKRGFSIYGFFFTIVTETTQANKSHPSTTVKTISKHKFDYVQIDQWFPPVS